MDVRNLSATLSVGEDSKMYVDPSKVEKLGLLGVSLMTEKVITLLAMTAITFLFGMLPLKLFSQLRHNDDLGSRTRWRTLISFCSCFSGGVFIAACLLDLLPDVEEKIEEVINSARINHEQ